MSTYEPPFHDPAVRETALRRGLLDESESLLDAIDRVADALIERDAGLSAIGTREFATSLRSAMRAGRVAVSSQLMAAAGRDNSVAACTVLPTHGRDDATRIRRAVAEVRTASYAGMGCGLDLTEFDDPVSAVTRINDAAQLVHTELASLGRRPPALMVTCAASHADAAAFAAAKQSSDLSGWVANISLRFTGDQSEWTRLRPTIARMAHRNGEPGVLFQNVADADNPTPDIQLTSTAPCAEVFLAEGERCVFVTVNIAAHVVDGRLDWRSFAESVRLAVRAGDAAVELASIGAESVVARRRRIGIGVCGFHSALISLGVPYDSAAPLAAMIAERLAFHAHRASADLAAARGAFPAWEGSRWQDQNWVRRKQTHRRGAIAPSSWEALERRIGQTGVRNAAVVAYPPTGVVAELLGVSRSYEPHFTLVGRTGVASRRGLRVAPEVLAAIGDDPNHDRLMREILDPATGHQVRDARPSDLLACARQISPEAHLAVHAAFSLLADEAGSKTVNLPQHASVADVESVLESSRQLGLKGVTIFRDRCLDEMENS